MSGSQGVKGFLIMASLVGLAAMTVHYMGIGGQKRYYNYDELEALVSQYAPSSSVEVWTNIFWCESKTYLPEKNASFADLEASGDGGSSHGFIQANEFWADVYPDYWNLLKTPRGNMELARRISRDWKATYNWTCRLGADLGQDYPNYPKWLP